MLSLTLTKGAIMSGNVTSLTGAPVPTMVPNESAIELLEEMLERARSGDVVGVCITAVHADKCGSYCMAGLVGGYSILGALEMAKAELIDVNLD